MIPLSREARKKKWRQKQAGFIVIVLAFNDYCPPMIKDNCVRVG